MIRPWAYTVAAVGGRRTGRPSIEYGSWYKHRRVQAKFPSKVDAKLAMLGIAAPCVAFIAVTTSARRPVVFPLALVTALVAALVVWIVLSTYYEITADLLIAHSGPFSWRIPLKDISRVRESRSARSGPALSLDRLEITGSGGTVLLISPRDQTGFLAALRARAPQLATNVSSST